MSILFKVKSNDIMLILFEYFRVFYGEYHAKRL